ncbi:MAG: cation:proton antiporter, partial [Halorhodospira sp.]
MPRELVLGGAIAALVLLTAEMALAAPLREGADPIAPVILSITGLLFFALLGQSLARAAGQPAVLGELLMGILLGNALYFAGFDLALLLREGQAGLVLVADAMRDGAWSGTAEAAGEVDGDFEAVLGVLQGPNGDVYLRILQTVDIFAVYGLIFLLFLVGLGTSTRELSSTGADSARVAILGVAAPFVLGLAAVKLLQPELGWESAVFVAATLAATSIGITARVLSDLHQDHAREAQVILGAAVLDDVLGLILLAVVSGVVVTGEFTPLGLAQILGLSGLFFVAAYYLSPPLLRLVIYLVRRLSLPEAKLFVAFLFTMLLAWGAKVLGLATIVGAFTAGVLLHDGYFNYWRG